MKRDTIDQSSTETVFGRPSNGAHMSSDDEEDDFVNVYIAGVFDAEQAVRCIVTKDSSSLLGYRILPKVELTTKSRELAHVVINWLRGFGVHTDFEKRGTNTPSYMISIERRGDVVTILQRIRPYLIVQDRDADLVLEEIVPRIEGGVRNEEEFVEILEYADSMSQAGAKHKKYDAEYFREEWGLEEGDEPTA